MHIYEKQTESTDDYIIRWVKTMKYNDAEKKKKHIVEGKNDVKCQSLL